MKETPRAGPKFSQMELDIDALTENHSEETSILLRARIMEAIVGELDYTIRTEAQLDLQQSQADLISSFAAPYYGSDAQQKDTQYSFGTTYPVAPNHHMGSYSGIRLMWYLLSELVKTILRLENAKPNAANIGSPRLNTKKENALMKNAIDLELFQHLHKGSVWQCFKRVHLLNDRKIRNTIRKAVPKLTKVRQITFSGLMHALCDVQQLTIYRKESLRNATELLEQNQKDVDVNVSRPKKNDPSFLKSQRDLERLYGKLETQELEETKSELFTTKRSITNPFHLTAHAHKELACLVINTFLSCTDVAEFYCSNQKIPADIRKSPFLSKQQKEMLSGRLVVGAVQEKDFGCGRFMHLEEWVPPPYRRSNVNLPRCVDPRPIVNSKALESKHAQRSYDNWVFTPRSRKTASMNSRFNRETNVSPRHKYHDENIDPGLSIVTKTGRTHSPGVSFGHKPKSAYLKSLKDDDEILCDVDVIKPSVSASRPGMRRQPLNAYERRHHSPSHVFLHNRSNSDAARSITAGGGFDNAVLLFKNMATCG